MGEIFINIQYELSKEDFIKGKLENKYKRKEFKLDLLVRTYIASFILLLVITLLLKKGTLFFLEVYILFIILFPTIYKEALLKKIRKKAKYTIYKFSFSLNDNGIEYATYSYRINIKWSSVTGIVETARYIHVFNDSNEAIFIPKKAFNTEEDIKNFIQKMNDQIELKGSE